MTMATPAAIDTARSSNGNGSILGSVLTAILGFQSIPGRQGY